MDQWLDSLSEDWPSEPPSQHNSSSISEDKRNHKSIGSQSRIPRRAASNVSSVIEKELGIRRSLSGGDAINVALKEKTPSSLNASQRRRSNGQVKPQSPNSAPKQKSSPRNHSTPLSPSTPVAPTMSSLTPVGTVAFKASPNKGIHQTPEWKRRVVQGKTGPGDQIDMFGPMGLQSVFKPPTIALRPKGQQKKESFKVQEGAESQMPSDFPRRVSAKPDSETCDQTKLLNQRAAREDDEEGKRGEKEDGHTSDAIATSEKQYDVVQGQSTGRHSPRLSTNRQRSTIDPLADPPSKLVSSPLVDSQTYDSSNHVDSKDFTPFYVSKSHTIDGKVDYAAIDMGMQRLHSNMEELRRSRQDHSGLQSEANDSRATSTETPGISFRKSQMNEITNQSLPEDLSVGTDAFAANGGFVSLHRGGYSIEGSFQKRPLSPSSSTSLDAPAGYSTRVSSQALPSAQHSQRKPRKPSTPPRTPDKDDGERPRSSGSPLKLFDKYDTFTNDRLARHISRFEETLAQNGVLDESLQADWPPSSPSPGPKVPRKLTRIEPVDENKPFQRVSSFGSGVLDNHDFDANDRIVFETTPFGCSWDENALQPLPSRQRRSNISRGSSRPSRTDQKHPASNEGHQEDRPPESAEDVPQPSQPTEEVSYTVHGKRLQNSPEKDMARKRRRTLCSSEERKSATLNAQPMPSIPFVEEPPTTAASGRKRKDACYDSERQAADPKTLAMRQILRPRNPTPNQTGYSNRQTVRAKSEHPQVTITGYGRKSVDQSVEIGLKSTLDPPTQIVAGALATIALNTVQDMASGSRKPSVTTSDFFNEAQQIMALIRAEKRPRSSHNSAEVSNMEHSVIQEEPTIADSTKDDLTRPPSREGGSQRRTALSTQQNARIVSHLRKFEDKEDLGLALPSSGKSLRINGYEAPSLAKAMVEKETSDVKSDPPNIRIREGGIYRQAQASSPTSLPQLDSKDEVDSRRDQSQCFGSSSAGKSHPTGSSHSSTNIRKIAPHNVAHLLSDQMADMFFDKERKVWVKRKVTPDSVSFDAEVYATSRQSEEDLFGDIPDLSVDEMEELKRVKDVVASGNHLSLEKRNTTKRGEITQSKLQQDEPAIPKTKPDARPVTADGKVIPQADNSSAPSKYTNFAWSGPVPGTRATSYGDDIWPDKTARQPTLPVTGNDLGSPEVEHEISILESREPRVSAKENKDYRQPRVVTVAFSSPLVQSPYQPDEDWEPYDESRLEESPSKQISLLQKSIRRPSSAGHSSGQRYNSRRLSVGNSSFLARPMSRLDELDEMSIVRYSVQRPQATMDLAISTPLPLSKSLYVPPTTGHRSSMGFSLSPLADFTVHQIDRPLDAEEGRVMQQQRPQAVSNALSLTAQDLVKHLTDAEPNEPYWDHLLAIELKDRALTSLHMLNEFCGRTQELDVSRNRIRELDGVPFTVRSLDISDNCLSELTAWHTLQNLQYLNVSGNSLRGLKGFQGLVHLRALKADDNEIESLDGIQCLDGLLRLSLRGNFLGEVDFNGFNL